MGLGFLQGFYEDEVLGERSEDVIARAALTKAKELAMLGLADEAHAIISTLHEFGMRSGKRPGSLLDTSLGFFYQAAGIPRPGATHGLSEQELKENQLEVLKDNTYHLPEGTNFGDISDESYARLSRFVDSIAATNGAHATTGYVVQQLALAR